MVGELRDRETAEMAVQAALTGHLVLTTLHTNDAPGAITRLIDMGIEPYLVAATVQGVLAQRLVRVTCAACVSPIAPDDDSLAGLGGPHLRNAATTRARRGAGCDACGPILSGTRRGRSSICPYGSIDSKSEMAGLGLGSGHRLLDEYLLVSALETVSRTKLAPPCEHSAGHGRSTAPRHQSRCRCAKPGHGRARGGKPRSRGSDECHDAQPGKRALGLLGLLDAQAGVRHREGDQRVPQTLRR